MEMLTVKEVAELKGCSPQYVKKAIADGRLEFQSILNQNNRKKYLIPLTALDPKLQQKYYNQNKVQSAVTLPSKQAEAKPFDHFTEDERLEIAFWIDILEKWQSYRNAPSVKKKTEVDELFVASVKLDYPDISISVDTLYRRLNAYKANDLDGLTDNRGKWKKGKTSIQKPMWDAFLYYFLDEAQHPVTKCYKYMEDVMKEQFPALYGEIPHVASFRRHIISELPIQLQILGRKGETAYRNACGFYIRREYGEMESNDYWIGDTHTIDVQSQAEDGSIHRLYLSAFMDARSAVMVGWHISASPSSQTTLLALRNGLMRTKAIPKNIYVDNGREFLTHDIGGLGHRKKKSKSGIETYEPPPVFKRLGIEMTNAIVKNARAKTIERRFKDFKDQISRLFGTYTGGNILERPECLKARIKNGEVIVDKQLIEDINQIIEYYFNYESYGGSAQADKGKRKIDVYYSHLGKTRTAPEEELSLMLMRSSRVQTFGKRGVNLKINGDKFDFYSIEAAQTMFGKQCYYRYDPYDLSSVRLYDLENKFIMTVPCTSDTVLKYGAGSEEIKNAQRLIRTAERKDKDMLREIRAFEFPAARELVLASALENQRNPALQVSPKVLELVRAEEQPLYKEAVGFANLDTINRNAMKKQGGICDE